MGNRIIKRVAAIVISLLLLSYVGLQIYNTKYSGIKTETAAYMTAADTIDTTGFVVRNETLVVNESGSVINYLVEDGESVKKDGVIAELFASAEDASRQNQISNLQSEIDNLNRLSTVVAQGSTTTPDAVDKQITVEIDSLLSRIHTESYDELGKSEDELQYLLNQRQIVTGKPNGFQERLSGLQSQVDALRAQSAGSTGSITAPASGYFVGSTDGYEGAYSYEDVQSITLDQLTNVPAQQQAPPNVIGKVVGDLNWYVVCKVPGVDTLNLEVGEAVDGVLMPSAPSESVPGKVVAINQQSRQDDAAVVIECNYMNSELTKARIGAVQVAVNTYSGLMVNKKGVHVQTVTKTITDESGNETRQQMDVQGVYVLYGSELVFKQIVPLHTYNSFVICDPNPEEDATFNGKTIQLYDEVVVGGTDLYDGKLVK